MFEEDDKIESKVHNTLRKHIGFWTESGASEFAVSVILNDYVPLCRRNQRDIRRVTISRIRKRELRLMKELRLKWKNCGV